MERSKKNEIQALLAVLGIAGLGCSVAAPPVHAASCDNGMLIAEKPTGSSKGKEMACGKGSCGVDEKGAAAAKAKHESKKAAESTAKPAVKTKTKASDKTSGK